MALLHGVASSSLRMGRPNAFGGGNIMVPVPDSIVIGDNPLPKNSAMPLLHRVGSWSLHTRGCPRCSDGSNLMVPNSMVGVLDGTDRAVMSIAGERHECMRF